MKLGVAVTLPIVFLTSKRNRLSRKKIHISLLWMIITKMECSIDGVVQTIIVKCSVKINNKSIYVKKNQIYILQTYINQCLSNNGSNMNSLKKIVCIGKLEIGLYVKLSYKSLFCVNANKILS